MHNQVTFDLSKTDLIYVSFIMTGIKVGEPYARDFSKAIPEYSLTQKIKDWLSSNTVDWQFQKDNGKLTLDRDSAIFFKLQFSGEGNTLVRTVKN